MLPLYTSYKCRTCGNEFILISDEVDAMAKGRYLKCPYCDSRRISKGKQTDDLKDCMKERCYRRENGALKQIR